MVYAKRPSLPSVATNEARYRRAPEIEERYVARDVGVQQTWTIEEPLEVIDGAAGDGDLVIQGTFDTNLHPVLVSPDEGVMFYLP